MLVAILVLAGSAAAQEETALAAPADLYKEPEGVPLVSLPAGAPVETGRARGGWHSAVVEGWIFTESTERTRRDGARAARSHGTPPGAHHATHCPRSTN